MTTPKQSPHKSPLNAPFAQRFTALRNQRGPFCLGLDPTPKLLEAWGLNDDVQGMQQFCFKTLDAAEELIAVFKPQSAYFERFGSQGVSVLEKLIDEIHARGSLALLDVKRGDIGSTNQAYASAYLGAQSAFKADAITVHPYLGFQALLPIFEYAIAENAGVFVVVLSSNPEGSAIQSAQTKGGISVVQALCDEINGFNRSHFPDETGPIGAVVGITAEGAQQTVERLPTSLILAPGLGAQGGRFSSFASLAADAKQRLIPISSRGVLSQGPSPSSLHEAIKNHCNQAVKVLES